MHVRVASSLLLVAACATTPRSVRIDNRDRAVGLDAPALIERPRWTARPMTDAADYPTMRAALRAPPGSCLHGFTARPWDRDAVFATTAAIAGTTDRCVLAAEAYIAELALALDRDGPGCRGTYDNIVRGWGVASRLASTQVRRRIALRNRAEAMWRAQEWDATWSVASGTAVARAFRAAVAAGDRAAIDGEVDAWINALVSSRRARGRSAAFDLAVALESATARYRSLVDPTAGRRLHAAIDLATHRLAKLRR